MARIIAVDLDGTLIHTDLLWEGVCSLLRKRPWCFYKLFLWFFQGKARFKVNLANAVIPDVEFLPYNTPLINWLKQQRAAGALLVLATATEERVARSIAKQVGLFDEVLATTQAVNLSSSNKRDALVGRYGERGFEYVGNAEADLAVWASASVIHVVSTASSTSEHLLKKAQKLGTLGEVFRREQNNFRFLLSALRPHQWIKNTLIFVPLLASHRFLELPLLINGLFAFIIFSVCASSVYLLNDLVDLNNDRQHPTKNQRALAAGRLSIPHVMLVIPVLLTLSLGLSLWLLPLSFTLLLALYFSLTLTYSVWLKRVAILDVITLSMLYTLRVFAGALAMSLLITFWILAFCMFIFLSLAFLKRYSELKDLLEHGKSAPVGRGYLASDVDLMASLGGASGYLSVLVLALYINDVATEKLYGSPEWMWIACPLLLFWLSRIWLLSHRGQVHDDPVVFALRDSVSRWVGLLFLLVFALAAS